MTPKTPAPTDDVLPTRLPEPPPPPPPPAKADSPSAARRIVPRIRFDVYEGDRRIATHQCILGTMPGDAPLDPAAVAHWAGAEFEAVLNEPDSDVSNEINTTLDAWRALSEEQRRTALAGLPLSSPAASLLRALAPSPDAS
jgi:hypothetical protein